MLTIPKEIVPLQIARGARADFPPALADRSLPRPCDWVAVGLSAGATSLLNLRAVLCAIPNIKVSPWGGINPGLRMDRLRFVPLGVVALVAGIWVVRRPAAAGSALWPALLTGVLIAAYTSLDRIGVRLGPPWIYGWLLWFFGAIFLIAYTTARRFPGSRLTDEPQLSATVGVLMTAAYFMILFAL